MSRDREAGARAPSPPRPAAWPWLPVVLLAAALLLGWSAGQPTWSGALQALALVLMFAGAVLAGAFWARQRQVERLREARVSQQLLGQLIDVWCWQTDAEHRLIRLQPPQGAPASAWVSGAFSGEFLWHRFNDKAGTLQARLQAQSPIGDLRVLQPAPGGQPDHGWRLRGLPRFDGRGHFAGFQGVAWPSDAADAQRTAELGLDALLSQGPAALCLALPAVADAGWTLVRANPAALGLMSLDALPAQGLPWAGALAGLPDGLAQAITAMAPGQSLDLPGWRLRLDGLDSPGSEARPALLLSLVAVAPAGAGLAEATRQAAAEEQASFSYTISHDLRAPIRVIDGFGRILKEDYGAALDRMGRDHLDRVLAAAARMTHMIDALLSLARLSTQPLAHQPVNLSQLAGWVAEDLQRAAPERTVACTIEPGLQTVGDPVLLRMALENLLGNAWKYSAKAAQPQIRFDCVEQAGRRVYRLRDNGAGFDMRFADRLFGVFQRLHSSSDFVGHGVGLASVQRIVRRHGGEIWAEGEVGVGATFSFTLPAAGSAGP